MNCWLDCRIRSSLGNLSQTCLDRKRILNWTQFCRSSDEAWNQRSAPRKMTPRPPPSILDFSGRNLNKTPLMNIHCHSRNFSPLVMGVFLSGYFHNIHIWAGTGPFFGESGAQVRRPPPVASLCSLDFVIWRRLVGLEVALGLHLHLISSSSSIIPRSPFTFGSTLAKRPIAYGLVHLSDGSNSEFRHSSRALCPYAPPPPEDSCEVLRFYEPRAITSHFQLKS